MGAGVPLGLSVGLSGVRRLGRVLLGSGVLLVEVLEGSLGSVCPVCAGSALVGVLCVQNVGCVGTDVGFCRYRFRFEVHRRGVGCAFRGVLCVHGVPLGEVPWAVRSTCGSAHCG